MKTITPILENTKKSSIQIARASDQLQTKIVQEIADNLEKNIPQILAANQKDLEKMSSDDPKYDRLLLNEERINAIASDARNVSKLPNPAGEVLLQREIEQGMQLQKISTPLGVVGIIYEARPNVTVDAIALTLKSGNAVVLRGGTDAEESNKILVKLAQEVLEKNNLPAEIITLLPTEREHVKTLLEAEKFVDIIIPRGSQGLINFVRENAKIPTIETGAGVCHTYIEKSANLEKSAAIVVNAKTQRPSVCNCLDTVLVDQEIAAAFLPLLVPGFQEFDVEVFADEISQEIFQKAGYKNLQKATEEDFGREFLSQACSVKIIDNNPEEAIEHIAKYSSRHSEAICTEDKNIAEKFLQEVDAAAVYHNASTRFTDGSVFALGAEIGISTQKLHARGPFALEKLVTEKWIVRGSGQIRG